MGTDRPFTAIVLAADRTGEDPVARAAGVACKAFAPIEGVPLVLRVLQTLRQSREVGERILCGPSWDLVQREPTLRRLIKSREIRWMAPEASPSASTGAALRSMRPETPALVTTADHAFLDGRIVDYFCREARATGCDVVLGLASQEQVAAAYRGLKRTALRFRDGAYCGCNLFAFLSSQGCAGVDFWRRIEHHRKRPVRIAASLGWASLLRFLFGRMSLDEATAVLSRSAGVRITALRLPFPEAAFDVDSAEQWRSAQARTRTQSE
jgi:molybdopterin-guanine dinucleotide biosynthesis protein A